MFFSVCIAYLFNHYLFYLKVLPSMCKNKEEIHSSLSVAESATELQVNLSTCGVQCSVYLGVIVTSILLELETSIPYENNYKRNLSAGLSTQSLLKSQGIRTKLLQTFGYQYYE